MANAAFYMRARGKVTGPFDLPTLQKLVRRGVLSRAHEVSADRASWRNAGEYEELFPAGATAVPGASAVPDSAAPAPQSAPQSAGNGAYYYQRDGTTVGPISLSILQMLTRQGVIGSNDLCWAEGGQVATPAGRLPALTTIFANRSEDRPRTDEDADSAPSDLATRARRILAETNSLCQLAGFIVGFVLLLFLNLPIGPGPHGDTRWWWDVLKMPRNGSAAVLLFFTLFAGLAAALIGAMVRGLVRAWSFIGISALSFILLFVTGLNEEGNGGGLFFSLAVFYLCAALLGLGLFRTKVQNAPLGKIFQASLGGALLFCILIVAVLSVTQLDSSGARRAFDTDPLPGWTVLALTIGVVAVVAAIAASVLGLCGVRQKYSRGVNGASMGSAAAAILLPLIAMFVVLCGLAHRFDEEQSSGTFIFLSFRVLSIVASFLALMAAGCFELFVASHVSKPAQPR